MKKNFLIFVSSIVLLMSVGLLWWSANAAYLISVPQYQFFMSHKTWFAFVDYHSSSWVVSPGAFFIPYHDVSFTGRVEGAWSQEAIFTMSSSSVYWWCELGYSHSPCGLKSYSWDFDHKFTLLTGWHVLNKNTLFTKDGVLVTTWFDLSTWSIKIINNNLSYIDGVFYQSGKRIGKLTDTKVRIIDDKFYKINDVVYSMHNVALSSIDAKTFKKLKNNPLKKKIHASYNPHYYQDKNNIYIRTNQVMPGGYREGFNVYDRKTKRLKGSINSEYDGTFTSR